MEWVLVERLTAEGSADTAEEYVLLTVRPVADPRKPAAVIAHFYTEESTSAFIVRRDGMV